MEEFVFVEFSSAGLPQKYLLRIPPLPPPWGLSKCSSLNDFLLPRATSPRKKEKKNASVDLVTSRRGDLLMGDLEIMEMFLLEPQEGGGSYTQSPADSHGTMQQPGACWEVGF